jgi:hypothetical protein
MRLIFFIIGIALDSFALIVVGLYAAFVGVGIFLTQAEPKENGR